MKRISTILLLLISTRLLAQDLNFSQFYELPLLRNPALAGIYDGDYRATAGFRSQWGSVTVPYLSQAASAELKSHFPRSSNNFLSVGLQVTNDVAGDSKLGRTQLFPLLAYHQVLSADNNLYLTLGAMGGPVQQRYDFTGLRFSDQFVNGAYNPLNPTRQPFTNTRSLYWDFSTGLTLSGNLREDVNFYAGAALFHVFSPNVAFTETNTFEINRKWVFNAGLSVQVDDDNKLIFYGDYFRQGGSRQAQGGAIYQKDMLHTDNEETISFSTGALLRWNDAVIPVVKLDYYKLAVGLSYDINISKLTRGSHLGGGWELTLSYKGFTNRYNSTLDAVRCKPISL